MNSDIQALVKDFAGRLSQIVRRAALERITAVIGGGDGAIQGKRGPGRPKGSTNAAQVTPAKGKRLRRSNVDLEVMSAALLAHVKTHPGQRGDQIAAALKTDVGTMRKPMKTLIAKKLVKTQGQRRGMTYSAAGSTPSAKRAGASPKRAASAAKRATKRAQPAKAKRGKGKRRK